MRASGDSRTAARCRLRAELATAACAVLSDLAEPRPRADDETDKLIALATFVVRARSAVERDGYSREIELVPAPEAPTRLVIVLDRLFAGLDAIGCDRDDAVNVVTKAALDGKGRCSTSKRGPRGRERLDRSECPREHA